MAAGSKGDQTSVFPAIFPRSLWRILRSSQARGMRNPSIVVRLYTWECLARTLKSSACWCPGGILISCPMLDSKLQNLPSKSENEPCHTVGETHFSHFHAQSLSFSHYPKLMSINEDWNTDLMLNRELSLPTQLSWTPQRSSTIPNYDAQHTHRLHNLRFLSPFTFGLFFFFQKLVPALVQIYSPFCNCKTLAFKMGKLIPSAFCQRSTNAGLLPEKLLTSLQLRTN